MYGFHSRILLDYYLFIHIIIWYILFIHISPVITMWRVNKYNVIRLFIPQYIYCDKNNIHHEIFSIFLIVFFFFRFFWPFVLYIYSRFDFLKQSGDMVFGNPYYSNNRTLLIQPYAIIYRWIKRVFAYLLC